MKIAPGLLDRRATLLQPTNVTDGIGEVSQAFTPAGQRWVSFLRLLPAEIDREQAAGSKAETKLLMYLDSLTETVGVRWRVAVDGVTWNVTGTEPTPRDGSLILYVAGVQA
jgi:head-tail adaptor